MPNRQLYLTLISLFGGLIVPGWGKLDQTGFYDQYFRNLQEISLRNSQDALVYVANPEVAPSFSLAEVAGTEAGLPPVAIAFSSHSGKGGFRTVQEAFFTPSCLQAGAHPCRAP